MLSRGLSSTLRAGRRLWRGEREAGGGRGRREAGGGKREGGSGTTVAGKVQRDWRRTHKPPSASIPLPASRVPLPATGGLKVA